MAKERRKKQRKDWSMQEDAGGSKNAKRNASSTQEQDQSGGDCV